MDLTVDYRTDGSVALMTRSGVGILDGKASVFSFASAGSLSANSQVNYDDAKNGVGKLMLQTASGMNIDVVKQNVLRSGEIAGLIDLRDNKLVQAQDQLDSIASSLALSMSTQATAGTQVTAGASNGYEVDIGNIQNRIRIVLDSVRLYRIAFAVYQQTFRAGVAKMHPAGSCARSAIEGNNQWTVATIRDICTFVINKK